MGEKWMENYAKDFFDADLIPELEQFINNMGVDSPGHPKLVCLLENNVKKFSKKYDFLTPRILSESQSSPLFMADAKIVAQQLCLLNQHQLCSIGLHELQGQAWNEP